MNKKLTKNQTKDYILNRKIKQKMTELIIDDGFLEYTKQLRLKYGIPQNGYDWKGRSDRFWGIYGWDNKPSKEWRRIKLVFKHNNQYLSREVDDYIKELQLNDTFAIPIEIFIVYGKEFYSDWLKHIENPNYKKAKFTLVPTLKPQPIIFEAIRGEVPFPECLEIKTMKADQGEIELVPQGQIIGVEIKIYGKMTKKDLTSYKPLWNHFDNCMQQMNQFDNKKRWREKEYIERDHEMTEQLTKKVLDWEVKEVLTGNVYQDANGNWCKDKKEITKEIHRKAKMKDVVEKMTGKKATKKVINRFKQAKHRLKSPK